MERETNILTRKGKWFGCYGEQLEGEIAKLLGSTEIGYFLGSVAQLLEINVQTAKRYLTKMEQKGIVEQHILKVNVECYRRGMAVCNTRANKNSGQN
jgi:hypothetical protein